MSADDEQCKEGISQSPVSTVSVVLKVLLKRKHEGATRSDFRAQIFSRSESLGFTKVPYVVNMFYRWIMDETQKPITRTRTPAKSILNVSVALEFLQYDIISHLICF